MRNQVNKTWTKIWISSKHDMGFGFFPLHSEMVSEHEDINEHGENEKTASYFAT